jgi:hypothetical protein
MRPDDRSRPAFLSVVMVGLGPTIHDFFGEAEPGGERKKSWMPATRAGMTK